MVFWRVEICTRFLNDLSFREWNCCRVRPSVLMLWDWLMWDQHNSTRFWNIDLNKCFFSLWYWLNFAQLIWLVWCKTINRTEACLILLNVTIVFCWARDVQPSGSWHCKTMWLLLSVIRLNSVVLGWSVVAGQWSCGPTCQCISISSCWEF